MDQPFDKKTSKKSSLPTSYKPRKMTLGGAVLSAFMGAAGCLKSPFGSDPQGLLKSRYQQQNLVLPTGSASTSPTSGSAGSLALSVGEQMVTRLETDLKAGGLTSDQISQITSDARKEMAKEAGKIAVSALHEWGTWLSNKTGFDLSDQNSDMMAKLGSAVARGAVKSLGSDQLKGLPSGFRQNAIGLMSTSVMSSMTTSPQKLSDAGISQIAESLIGSLVTSLPDAGFSGAELMMGMSKVMEKAVGALDEAGLSADATADAVVAMTQTTLTNATEMTKGSPFAGDSIGVVAAAAISGLSATGVSASQSMSAIVSVTTTSVKAVIGQDGGQVDLAKSIENLTNLSTKAMSNVTAAGDTVSGLERLMGAASQAVSDATAKSSGDLFAKMTAGIVAGSVAAVDTVAAKSGTGAANLVQTMVATTASKAAQSGASNADMIKMLSEVTGSAVKAFASSSLGQDPTTRNQAIGFAVAGTVGAISKMPNQDSGMNSAAIQGISKAGTQAAATLTTNAADMTAMTKQIINTGITTASSTLAGTDSTKMISLASDMARGAASGMAGQNNKNLGTNISDLASFAVSAVNQASATMGTSPSINTILTSFASSVASAISSGLAVGGESASAISAMTANLSNTIVQSVVVFAPTINTTTLSQDVNTQANTGATLATTIAAGGIPGCAERFSDDITDAIFTTQLSGKRTEIFCRILVAQPLCPKPRKLDSKDYYWSMNPPDLCEFRLIPLAANTPSTDPTGLSTTTSTATGVAQGPMAGLPPPLPLPYPGGTYTNTNYSTGTYGGYTPPPMMSPSFAYYYGSSSFSKDQPLNITLTNYGALVASCSVSPALPAGLSVNVSGTTCQISGTPTTVTAWNSYTITGVGANGMTGTTTLSMDINNLSPMPFLFSIGQPGSLPGEFQFGDQDSGGHLFVTNSHIFVSDWPNKRLQKLDLSGNPVAWFGYNGTTYGFFASNGSDTAQSVNFKSPFYINSTGHIFLTAYNEIKKINSSGTYINSVSLPFNSYLRFTMDSGGNYLVQDDMNRNIIKKYNSTGTFQYEIGGNGGADGQFNQNGSSADLVVDTADNLYVLDVGNHRVQKFDSSGAFILNWPVTLSSNGKMAIDGTNNIYVTTGYHLIKFNQSGVEISRFLLPGYDVKSIFVKNNRLYVTHNFSSNSDSIRVYSLDQTLPPVPPVVTGLTYKVRSQSVILTWDRSPFARSYEILRSTTPGTGYGYPYSTESNRQYDSYLVPGQTYYYQIRAVNSAGASAPTAELAVTVPTVTPSPAHFLYSIGQSGSGNGQFNFNTGSDKGGNIFVANNQIYVSDWENNRLQIFNESTGAFVNWLGVQSSTWNFYTTGTSSASGIYGALFVDSSGSMYLASNGSVVKCSSSPSVSCSNISVDLSNFRRFTVNSLGNLFVQKNNNNTVAKYDAGGTFALEFGSYGVGNGQFINNGITAEIVMDSSNNVYMLDSGNRRVQKFTNLGVFVKSWPVEIYGYSQMSIDENNHLYVLEGSNLNKYNTDGDFLGFYPLPSSFMGSVRSIFTRNGRLYLSFAYEPMANRVRVLSIDGTLPPAVPTAVTSVEKGSKIGSISLKWPPVASAAEYRVFRSTDGTNYNQMALVAGSTFQDYNLSPGTTYTYKIVATNSLGDATPSPVVTVTAPNITMSTMTLLQTIGGYGSGLLDFNFNSSGDRGGGISVSSTSLYVTDGGNQRVQVFNASDYSHQGWLGYDGSSWGYKTTGSPSNFPVYAPIFVNSSQNVYVNIGNTIRKFLPDGTNYTDFPIEGSGFRRFTVNSAGRIIAQSNDVNTIKIYENDGSYLSSFGTMGPDPGQFDNNGYAANLVVDSSDQIFVIDRGNRRLQKFSSTGGYLSSWLIDTYNIPTVAIDGAHLYVMEGYYLTKYDSNGVLLSQWQLPQSDQVGSIFVKNSKLYVTFSWSNVVKVYML